MCSETQKMMAVKLIFWNKRIIDFEDRDVKTRACLKNKSCTKHIFPRPFS